MVGGVGGGGALPTEPVKAIRRLNLALRSAAIKKVLSPISETKMSEKACTKPGPKVRSSRLMPAACRPTVLAARSAAAAECDASASPLRNTDYRAEVCSVSRDGEIGGTS